VGKAILAFLFDFDDVVFPEAEFVGVPGVVVKHSAALGQVGQPDLLLDGLLSH